VHEYGKTADQPRFGRAGMAAEREREPDAEQAGQRQAASDATGLRRAAEQTGEQCNSSRNRGNAVGRIEPRLPRDPLPEARDRQPERVEPLQADRYRRRDEAGEHRHDRRSCSA